MKARADHLVVGESASVPSAAKVEAATVPSAAVGETTAGVAVEAAGAAIPAVVKETWPVTERGKGEIPGQAARTVNPTVNRQKHGQSMGPQAWHPAADIGSAGVAVGAAGAAIPEEWSRRLVDTLKVKVPPGRKARRPSGAMLGGSRRSAPEPSAAEEQQPWYAR